MADNGPTQEEKPTLTPEQADDIGAVYYNGLRTTLASYLLERLLMALALQIVNDSTDSDGQFQYEKAKHVLDEFKEKSKGGFEHKRQVITKEDVYKEIRDEAKNLSSKKGDDQKTSLEKIKVLDNLIFKLLEKQPKNTEKKLKEEQGLMKLLEETENLSNGTCQDNIESLKKLREHRRKILDAWKEDENPSQYYHNLFNEAENLLEGTYVNKVESLEKITALGRRISDDSKKRRRQKPQELVNLGAKIACKARPKISDDDNSLFDFARRKLEQELDRMRKSEERTLSPEVCKMIRVAAVYEECMESRWCRFVSDKIRELLFGDKTIDKKSDAGDTAQPQNPMDLIKYLFLDRNQAAHSGSLGETTSIDTFMEQLADVDELLHPYFQDSGSAEMSDEDKKKNLKLLFGDCDAINVIDEIYTDRKQTYPNFEKKVKDIFKSLEDGVSDAEDEEAWSRVKMYYNNHYPTSYEDNHYYKMLLKQIKNHQKILDNCVEEDREPLEHLRKLHEHGSTTSEQAVHSASDDEADNDSLMQGMRGLWQLQHRPLHKYKFRKVRDSPSPPIMERYEIYHYYLRYLYSQLQHPDLVLDPCLAEPDD